MITASEIRRAANAADAAERLLMVALIVENPELGVSLRDALDDRNRKDERE